MNAPELAIIIPYAGEFPHLHYTLQAIQMELEGRVNFEVMAVKNWSTALGCVTNPNLTDGEQALDAMTAEGEYTPWLRRLSYDGRLSHWTAKSLAVRNTEAPILFFCDAHVMPYPGTLRAMFRYYAENKDRLNGSLHLPIADFFRPHHRKVYRCLYGPKIGLLHYENNPDPSLIAAIRPIPCMSTCGMMCERGHIVDDLEYWPRELGPYGGGENYFNFVMAQMGRNINLYPTEPLMHWHVPGVWSRDYQLTSYQPWARNILIATYLVAGYGPVETCVRHYAELPKWHPVRQCGPGIRKVLDEIVRSTALHVRRKRLKDRFTVSLDEWAARWDDPALITRFAE